jgi:hypothetical protein
VNILEENNFGIHSAPLGSFDQEYDVVELKEMDEEVFGASQANGRSKRSVNCMETEDIALGKA